jgi:mRNA interferase RelE/StbE
LTALSPIRLSAAVAPEPPRAVRLSSRTLRVDAQGDYGYILARMRYEIYLAPEAIEDLKRLKAPQRAQAREAMETHLRHEPTKTSKSRIKRLRGLSRPQYRLRINDLRVFYDVSKRNVEGLAVVAKADAAAWLSSVGDKP